jgi:coenzyme F420 hydrogenase subunit beta
MPGNKPIAPAAAIRYTLSIISGKPSMPPTNMRQHGFCDSATCASCGCCVYLSGEPQARMIPTLNGYKPEFPAGFSFDDQTPRICPGLGIHYPDTYQAHYGRHPDNWLTGIVQKVRTGYASDPAIRLAGASGGVITRTLLHLLESGRIDGAILAKQGDPAPLEASPVIATTPDDILGCAGSVYIAVPMIPALARLAPGKRYAFVGTPEQTAALRALQQIGDARARQIAYVLGPYTGTALTPQALLYYLRSNRIKPDDPVTSVKWRAGEWPGYLEITTASGVALRSPKVYYNFLIPFFVTTTSLLSMDFCNEFCDLAVGDAWSPKFENARQGGVSVVATRTPEMEAIIQEMEAKGLLVLTQEDPLKAGDMHGHMLDFKKRGGYLRCRMRRFFGKSAPDYGYAPKRIAAARKLVECVISFIFTCCRTRPARWLVCQIPEKWLGPAFNRLRLTWKAISRPTKRKGLTNYEVEIKSFSSK